MKRVQFELCQAGLCRHLEVMTRTGGAFKVCDFPSLFGLIAHPEEGFVLYDTGYHPQYNQLRNKWPEGIYPRAMPATINPLETAAEQIRQKGASVDDVKLVVLSHFHGDHMAGLRDFPKAKILCSKVGFEKVHGRSGWRNLLNGYLPDLLPEDFHQRVLWIEDLKQIRSSALKDNLAFDLFGDGALNLINLSGHKNGQYGLSLSSEKAGECLLVADAAWSKKAIDANQPPPAIASAIFDNWSDYRRTLRELHELSLRRPALHLIPSHCQETFESFRRLNQ